MTQQARSGGSRTACPAGAMKDNETLSHILVPWCLGFHLNRVLFSQGLRFSLGINHQNPNNKLQQLKNKHTSLSHWLKCIQKAPALSAQKLSELQHPKRPRLKPNCAAIGPWHHMLLFAAPSLLPR